MRSQLLALSALVSLVLSSLVPALAHAQGPGPVTTVVVNGKSIMANVSRMTVYSFDPDAPGESKCYKQCASEWPPVLVDAKEALAAPFAATKRKEGTLQLTYKSHPLYLYVDDQKPGDIEGDGLGGIWHVVPYKGL